MPSISQSDNPQGVPAATGSGVDESSLLARMRAGEDAAYDELVEQPGGRLFAVAVRMLGDQEDAKDAVQEGFLSVFRSLEQFDGRSSLSTWVHRIVMNACLMKLRWRRRHPERAIESLLPAFGKDGHSLEVAKPWRPAPAGGIERQEMAQLIRDKVEELPGPYREVVVMRDLAGIDTLTTASLLGLSESAVKTRLSRARLALRAMLDPYFVEDDA